MSNDSVNVRAAGELPEDEEIAELRRRIREVQALATEEIFDLRSRLLEVDRRLNAVENGLASGKGAAARERGAAGKLPAKEPSVAAGEGPAGGRRSKASAPRKQSAGKKHRPQADADAE
jgi:hypothetical protein